jgi:hypothetical protein
MFALVSKALYITHLQPTKEKEANGKGRKTKNQATKREKNEKTKMQHSNQSFGEQR